MKERYFHAVLSACKSWHGSALPHWNYGDDFDGGNAFDAAVRRFEAMSDEETAMVGCTNRWAGAIIGDRVETKMTRWRDVSGVLEVSISGQNYAPPERIFNVTYTKFIPAGQAE